MFVRAIENVVAGNIWPACRYLPTPALDQRSTTGVTWHTGVHQGAARCAAGNFIWNYQHHSLLLETLARLPLNIYGVFVMSESKFWHTINYDVHFLHCGRGAENNLWLPIT